MRSFTMNTLGMLASGVSLCLAGCMVAAAPTVPTGPATISLLPTVNDGGYRTQGASLTASDINHLQVKLFRVASGSEIPITSEGGQELMLDLPAASLSVPLVFTNLAYNTSYRVRAYAFSDAGTASLISTTDAGSYRDVTVLLNDRPVMGTLPVKLLDQGFRGEATISAGVGVIAGGLKTNSAAAATGGWWVDYFGDLGPTGHVSGLAVDSQGYVWVSTGVNNTILKFSPSGQQMASFDGSSSSTSFSNPTGLAFDPAGNLIIADSGHNRICRMTPLGVVTQIAGQGFTGGYQDASALVAFFWSPRGVAVDASGTIYVADRNNSAIRMIANDQVTTVAGYPWPNGNVDLNGAVDGATTSAKFLSPVGIVVDSHHNLFVADDSGPTIRKITPDGMVTTFAGGSRQFGSIDGATSSARFKSPTGLAIDRHDNLYVADKGNNEIRMITPDGYVSTFAGSTTASLAAGFASQAGFNTPTAIAVDATGSLYVGDDGNQKIRKMH